MPKQRRWQIKRLCDHSINSLNKAQKFMVLAGHDYDDIHPDYYEAFSAVAQVIESVKSSIGKLRDMV